MYLYVCSLVRVSVRVSVRVYVRVSVRVSALHIAQSSDLQTVYHLYNLYLYPTEDDTDGKRLTQMLLESKGKARHRSVPRHQSDDLR